MTLIKSYIVDSFTDERFKGNPAGVCHLENQLEESLMQNIAFELGLSETAFIQQLENNTYSIRYFSPKMEIPLCGHATLAAAKAIFENSNITSIQFVTIENIILNIVLKDELIQMSFPIYNLEKVDDVNSKLLAALGIEGFTDAHYNSETNILMLCIKDSSILRRLSPDFNSLVKSCDKYNGILITALSNDPNYDFESRYFWPWSGTNEDPVTGGTHTFLAPYWAKKLNKSKLSSFQCSKRTGNMKIEMGENHILINANAVIVFEGKLNL